MKRPTAAAGRRAPTTTPLGCVEREAYSQNLTPRLSSVNCRGLSSEGEGRGHREPLLASRGYCAGEHHALRDTSTASPGQARGAISVPARCARHQISAPDFPHSRPGGRSRGPQNGKAKSEVQGDERDVAICSSFHPPLLRCPPSAHRQNDSLLARGAHADLGARPLPATALRGASAALIDDSDPAHVHRFSRALARPPRRATQAACPGRRGCALRPATGRPGSSRRRDRERTPVAPTRRRRIRVFGGPPRAPGARRQTRKCGTTARA